MLMYATSLKSLALSVLILGASATAAFAQAADVDPAVPAQSDSATPKFFLTLTESIDYAQKNSYEIS